MLQSVEWGEYKLGDLFEVKSNPQLDKNNFSFSEYGEYPYFTRTIYNNGILGNVDYLDEEHKIAGECIAVGMLSMQFFYMQKDFYAGQFTKRLIPKDFLLNPRRAQFINSLLNKYSELFKSVLVRDFENKFINSNIQLPVKNGSIDFEFMENFIAELEAYLTAAGLKNYELTAEEEEALEKLQTVEWKKYNLKALYGPSTCGKRLKSLDRIPGKLPFVTAGEADEGISDFIGNHVHVFKKNTTTIDMFGSAKYRNYDYGGDDHVAVVHTENVPPMAAVFVTTAIHKASHCGQFDYSRNFYAKDADALNILLPQANGEIDYAFMQTFISAIQKLVIKDVVAYSDRKMAATKQAASK